MTTLGLAMLVLGWALGILTGFAMCSPIINRWKALFYDQVRKAR